MKWRFESRFIWFLHFPPFGVFFPNLEFFNDIFPCTHLPFNSARWNFSPQILRNGQSLHPLRLFPQFRVHFPYQIGTEDEEMDCKRCMNSSPLKQVPSQFEKLSQALWALCGSSFEITFRACITHLLLKNSFNVNKCSSFDLIFRKQHQVVWCQIW